MRFEVESSIEEEIVKGENISAFILLGYYNKDVNKDGHLTEAKSQLYLIRYKK